jgi:tetratricopeptide (TPR) repeat protein
VLRATLLLTRGRRLSDEGKYDESRELELKALPLFERHGSDEASDTLNALGIDADMQGRYEEAKSYYGRALDQYERLLGPEHPAVAKALNNLGLMAADQAKWDDAIAALTRAIRINERALGEGHPDVAVGLANLAMVYGGMNRHEEALPLAERAVASIERGAAPDGPNMAFALSARISALLGLDRSAEAIAPSERELAIRERGVGAAVNLADARCDLGMALVYSGRDVARGKALLHQARDGFIAVGRTARVGDLDRALAFRRRG